MISINFIPIRNPIPIGIRIAGTGSQAVLFSIGQAIRIRIIGCLKIEVVYFRIGKCPIIQPDLIQSSLEIVHIISGLSVGVLESIVCNFLISSTNYSKSGGISCTQWVIGMGSNGSVRISIQIKFLETGRGVKRYSDQVPISVI